MTPAEGRTRSIDKGGIKVRADDARSLISAAHMFVDSADIADWKTAGANAVHAGIAASDAICGHVLGYHSRGQDYKTAVDVLRRATQPDNVPSNDLGRLINEKDQFDYGSQRVT
jgi:hypothetical protein